MKPPEKSSPTTKPTKKSAQILNFKSKPKNDNQPQSFPIVKLSVAFDPNTGAYATYVEGNCNYVEHVATAIKILVGEVRDVTKEKK